MKNATTHLSSGLLFHHLKKVTVFLIPFLIFFLSSMSQTFPPENTSCTSKDLAIVDARLKDPCKTCVIGQPVTRELEIGVYNKTGSTRTAFKFWAYIEERTPLGVLVSTTKIDNELTNIIDGKCVGTLEKYKTTYGTTGTITYTCGNTLKLVNVWEAWTDASDKSTCETITPTNISPKCGRLPEVIIRTPLSAGHEINGGSCVGGDPTQASIILTVSGGLSPYKYSWSNGSTNKDITGITASSGTYSVTASDSNAPTACTITYGPITVTVGQEPSAPVLTKVEPTLCGTGTGSLTVTAPTGAGYSYSINGTYQTNTAFTGLAAGSNPIVSVKNADGCIASIPCSSATNGLAAISTPVVNNVMNNLGSNELGASFTVKASPNPFNDQVRFTINSLESGNGRLDIYNIYGQKIKTVFQGNVKQGVNYFELRLIGGQRTNELVYIFSMGTQSTSGKLIQLGEK